MTHLNQSGNYDDKLRIAQELERISVNVENFATWIYDKYDLKLCGLGSRDRTKYSG